MNPDNNKSPQETRSTGSGSFFEPRTIPEKWDVSAFDSHAKPAQNSTEPQSEESVEQPQPDSDKDETNTWNPEPFPQPRTIPGNWDVSDMK